MRTMGKIDVIGHEDGSFTLQFTNWAGDLVRDHIPAGTPILFTDNAIVLPGKAWSGHGLVFRTTNATPTEAWDNGETLYIRVKGGHTHQFSLSNGRKRKN